MSGIPSVHFRAIQLTVRHPWVVRLCLEGIWNALNSKLSAHNKAKQLSGLAFVNYTFHTLQTFNNFNHIFCKRGLDVKAVLGTELEVKFRFKYTMTYFPMNQFWLLQDLEREWKPVVSDGDEQVAYGLSHEEVTGLIHSEFWSV